MNKNHWNGKLWYAYGTSMTEQCESEPERGNYVETVAALSGLRLVNKGKGGACLTPDGWGKGDNLPRVMCTDDGKCDADLITLEVLPNEGKVIGDIFDRDDKSICGCLNRAIAYLQENTRAQIVLILMIRGNTTPAEKPIEGYDHSNYELAVKAEQVARLNGIPCINAFLDAGFGYERVKARDYQLDQIHLNKLGGKIMGNFIWSKLKDIPLWMPEERPILREKSHWNDKLWYAYGTSLTAQQPIAEPLRGNYVETVQEYSGMRLVNKGQGGFGLTPDGWGKCRNKPIIMNLDDGKCDADLITVEVLPNEGKVAGEIFDTCDETVCGAVNQVIRYLQKNTRAQIVLIVMILTNKVTADEPIAEGYGYSGYEIATKIEQVARLNGIPCINTFLDSGFGYERVKNHEYQLDHIHLNKLGGRIMGDFVWSKLKNIPLWMPEV